MVIGEFSFCICGITFHLLYVFYQRFGERKHTVGIFGTIVFKFHHAIVRVIIRAGDADHFKIRTTDGVILFDGKSVTMAQIAGDKLVERTTDKVLVDLIENLCGELSQILLEIVLHKGFKTTIGQAPCVGSGLQDPREGSDGEQGLHCCHTFPDGRGEFHDR